MEKPIKYFNSSADFKRKYDLKQIELARIINLKISHEEQKNAMITPTEHHECIKKLQLLEIMILQNKHRKSVLNAIKYNHLKLLEQFEYLIKNPYARKQ